MFSISLSGLYSSHVVKTVKHLLPCWKRKVTENNDISQNSFSFLCIYFVACLSSTRCLKPPSVRSRSCSGASPLNPSSWSERSQEVAAVSARRSRRHQHKSRLFILMHLVWSRSLVWKTASVCCRSPSVLVVTVWRFRIMADGPEAQADVDDPPSISFPPLITVSDLPGATAAGNHGWVKCEQPWVISPHRGPWCVSEDSTRRCGDSCL